MKSVSAVIAVLAMLTVAAAGARTMPMAAAESDVAPTGLRRLRFFLMSRMLNREPNAFTVKGAVTMSGEFDDITGDTTFGPFEFTLDEEGSTKEDSPSPSPSPAPFFSPYYGYFGAHCGGYWGHYTPCSYFG